MHGYQLCAVAPPIAAVAVVSPSRRPLPLGHPSPLSLLPLLPSSPFLPSLLLPLPLRCRRAICRRCVAVTLSIAVVAVGHRAVWPRQFGLPCCRAATDVAAKPPPCCPPHYPRHPAAELSSRRSRAATTVPKPPPLLRRCRRAAVNVAVLPPPPPLFLSPPRFRCCRVVTAATANVAFVPTVTLLLPPRCNHWRTSASYGNAASHSAPLVPLVRLVVTSPCASCQTNAHPPVRPPSVTRRADCCLGTSGKIITCEKISMRPYVHRHTCRWTNAKKHTQIIGRKYRTPSEKEKKERQKCSNIRFSPLCSKKSQP